ncbi:MAG: hypothetical protein DRO90_03420 [Candidatus Altiarchaeales archaeon]|nr:MAG: hypothetical protein DRO90_03420 [Candidatus Altiarchaeales archaeon]
MEDKSNIIGIIFDFAIHLEEENHFFYNECALKVRDKEAKDMFNFLANEESKHRDIVINLKNKYLMDSDEEYQIGEIESGNISTEVIDKDEIVEKYDLLDVLNRAIYVEKQSIKLYKNLLNEEFPGYVKDALRRIIEEEERHLSILENEMKSVTDVGAFVDFREVTY